MPEISQNQYDYLSNLSKGSDGNAAWAKSQLDGATVAQPQPVTTPTTTYTPTPYSQGNNYGVKPPAMPQPTSQYTSPAPNYSTPSTPSYATPSAYTGDANVIGNVSGSTDLGKSYQDLYNSTRNDSNRYNQQNTWSDNKGSVYDTTQMTPQQTYALMLNKNGDPNAGAVLKGMGLDMNGNPTMPSSVSQYSSAPNVGQPITSTGGTNTAYASYKPEVQYGTAIPLDAGQLGASGNGMPSMYNPYGLSGNQLSSIVSGADAQSAADIAAQTTIANQQKAAYQQSYDRQNQQTVDTRNLENFKNSQLLNPFNGYSDYAQGQIARERATTDRQNGQDLQTKIGNVDAQLADYSKSSLAKKQQMINDMEAKVADYQLKKDEYNLRVKDQQSRNDIAKSGVTGYYQDSQQVSAVQKQMAANSAAYANSSPEEQQRLHDENVALAKSIGGTDTTGSGDYSFGQGVRTVAGQTLDLNNAKDMATLTGYMSDGKGGYVPTNAKQQQDLTNAWKETEQMGTVTRSLSALTGIPEGTSTQAAKTAAAQINLETAKANSQNALAEKRLNLDGKGNSIAQQRLNQDANAKNIEGEVYNHAQEFQSEQDVNDYFKANGAYLTKNLGSSAVENMRKSFLSSYTQSNKADTSLHQRAVAEAMKDPRFLMTDQDKNVLIKEYEGYLSQR